MKTRSPRAEKLEAIEFLLFIEIIEICFLGMDGSKETYPFLYSREPGIETTEFLIDTVVLQTPYLIPRSCLVFS